MRGRMVSKTWNRYLSQQKCIWMAYLRKTLSFLDYFEEMAQDIRMPFDSLEENGKVEDIICVFQKIQCLAFFNYHASNHAMRMNCNRGDTILHHGGLHMRMNIRFYHAFEP